MNPTKIQMNYPVGSTAYLFNVNHRTMCVILIVTRHNADGGLSLADKSGSKVRVTKQGYKHDSENFSRSYICIDPAEGIRSANEAIAERLRVNSLNKIREANEALAKLLRKSSPDMAEVTSLAESIAASAKRHATL